MDENELEPEEKEEEQPAPMVKGVKERFYDKIPVSVGALDVIIKLLFAAVVVVIILGIAAGSGGA